MKGLLIKDMSLMLGQKRFFLIVLGMGILLMFSGNQPSSAIGYVTMLITIFSLNTLSYDEHENGMSFLFTLPVKREIYVLEKFVFAGILAAASCSFAMAAAYAATVMKSLETSLAEILVTGVVLAAVSLMIFAITLPLQIKFGAEKGRVAMFAVFALLGVVVALAVNVLKNAECKNLQFCIIFCIDI